MRFLITCYRLDLSGSSTYTFTLATELKKKGHDVHVFSPFPEIIANELEKKKIKVHNNLEELSKKKYTCIVAQHNILALMIRSIKPEVPMIFISHGRILPQSFLEQPPSININIQKYIAISERIKHNLVSNHCIPDRKVQIVRNFVDVSRFFPQTEIREEPKVVLFMSNYFTSNNYEIIKKACDNLKLQLIHIGQTKQVLNTQDYINKADIVVSLGRGILEAMACGRAAIVYGYLGGDGMITSSNMGEVRKHNFSGRRFKKDYEIIDLIQEIQKYEPSMGKINREIILKEYNSSSSVDTIIDICNQARKDFSFESVSIPCRELEWYQNYVKEFHLINSDRSTIPENAQQELRAIYNSHGWRFLTCYYKFRDKIFPLGTIRRKVAKAIHLLFFNRNEFKQSIKRAFCLCRQGCRRTIFPKSKANQKSSSLEQNQQDKKTLHFPESALAHQYCVGKGLEIGGSAHNPFGLDTLNVDFTDSMYTKFKKEEIRLYGKALKVDIVAPGDDIPLPNESQDFIVSSHVVEHFPNPVKALIEWDRLVKPKGIIFMIVPHKERTFDKGKKSTPLEHLIKDFKNDNTEPHTDPDGHDHCWITESFVELINWMIRQLHMKWEIIEVQDVDDKVGNGFTVVIRKMGTRDALTVG